MRRNVETWKRGNAETRKRELGYTNMPVIDKALTSATARSSLALERLGYMRGQEMLQLNRPDDDDQRSLRVIFAGRGLATQTEQRTTVGLERAIRLFPALALEYTRLASLWPGTVGVDAGTLQPTDMSQRSELVKQAIDQFSNGVDLGRTVLRGLVAVLASSANVLSSAGKSTVSQRFCRSSILRRMKAWLAARLRRACGGRGFMCLS